MNNAASWLLALGIVGLFYGALGVLAGRKYDYVTATFHVAVSSAPESFYRLTRAQNWIGYRYRKLLISIGSAALVAFLIDIAVTH